MMGKRIAKKDLAVKLGFTAFYFAVVFLFRCLHISCFFRHFLHIPCPGCGMTRAWLAVLHGNFAGAFRMHAMFWSMPLLYAYFILDGHLFGKRADRVIFYLILAGFIVTWVSKLVLQLI